MANEIVEGDICQQNSCHHCCLETEMLITKKDIQRIVTKTSISAKEFVTLNDDGNRKLKNKQIDSQLQCFFLDQNGQCSIYEFRPEGCQFYPYIWDLTEHRIFIDDYCLHHNKFQKPWFTLSKRLEDFIFKLFGKL
ncbi:MAG: YkgJ family cysteine cluster protein [Candidatus Heimdallarchaeota archaeon]|nr:MAG: YkgJ family cysteine cluster protein [Candidatus Heimdallarchaeota archaeon]